MKINQLKLYLLSALVISPATLAYSQEDPNEDEVNSLFAWSDAVRNDVRFSWDLSTRSVHAAGVDRTGFLTAFGADIHKVFSSPAGDIGTLRLQGYALRADGLPMTPGFFDSAHDWEWTYRFFDFNYTRYASELSLIHI